MGGVALDGDPISGKLSIGCDASSRTTSPGLPGPELGLDGHNKFEGDTSLTRNDYFLDDGDNFSFNLTKYKRMSQVCKGSFDRKCMSDYRYERYQESLNWNGNFYFGPKSLLLFGAFATDATKDPTATMRMKGNKNAKACDITLDTKVCKGSVKTKTVETNMKLKGFNAADCDKEKKISAIQKVVAKVAKAEESQVAVEKCEAST